MRDQMLIQTVDLVAWWFTISLILPKLRFSSFCGVFDVALAVFATGRRLKTAQESKAFSP